MAPWPVPRVVARNGDPRSVARSAMTPFASPPRYNAEPCYPPSGRPVASGWEVLVESLSPEVSVVAIDGPMIANWPECLAGLGKALAQRGRQASFVDAASWSLPWRRIQDLTSSYQLRDDPDFDFLASGKLAELLRPPAHLTAAPGELVFVHGPGASLGPHDTLWYLDLPKRHAEAAIAGGNALNLGQPLSDGPGTTKRLFFIDWPLLDRHRDAIAGQIAYWVDAQDAAAPAVVDGDTLRATMADLATRPFRTRPTFNVTPWGGHWAQRYLGHNPNALNTALGYELIAPEAGVLVGTDWGPKVEVPLQLMVALHPVAVLGEHVHALFGTSFPIRFDYLDTFGGGNLSVHCHPKEQYMRDVFGWPYTQHESYYMMVGARDHEVFLGLRQDADVGTFYQEAQAAYHDGAALEIASYVQSFPATPHSLFLVPAGTPHGSGRGNVVLEISATPYLYSLRFYDWLRRDVAGTLRPVHVRHAFENLDTTRRGDAIARDLLQRPRSLRHGDGWDEELLGALPEMFFEVHRFSLRPGGVADDNAAGRFHVLNVVDGNGVVVEPSAGPSHTLVYAETLVVPSALGPYKLRALGDQPTRIVKAQVR